MENFIFCAVLKSPVWKSFSYFLEKSFSNFQGTELSYIFFKKVFLYFGKGIFRILTYLELEAYSKPEAYSEHCQVMECFAKLVT